jgi:hypothetical protein
MKAFKSLIVIVSVFFMSMKETNVHAQNVSVSFQTFYDELSPYGYWIDYPGYGYVWAPAVGAGFAPYATAGYWVYTDLGWTWVSNYRWGWAPFHYGRWHYDDFYGWLWLPGNEWAPAWVVWRSSPGYYGWAPMGPGVYVVSGNNYNIHHHHWVFVEQQYLGDQNISSYYGPRKNNSGYISNSRIVEHTQKDNSRNTTFFSGPPKDAVERGSKKEIPTYQLKDNFIPGLSLKKDQVYAYRPKVQEGLSKPSRLASKDEVKSQNERAVLGPNATGATGRQPGKNTYERNRKPVLEEKKLGPKELEQPKLPSQSPQRETPKQKELGPKTLEQPKMPAQQPAQKELPKQKELGPKSLDKPEAPAPAPKEIPKQKEPGPKTLDKPSMPAPQPAPSPRQLPPRKPVGPRQ